MKYIKPEIEMIDLDVIDVVTLSRADSGSAPEYDLDSFENGEKKTIME